MRATGRLPTRAVAVIVLLNRGERRLLINFLIAATVAIPTSGARKIVKKLKTVANKLPTKEKIPEINNAMIKSCHFAVIKTFCCVLMHSGQRYPVGVWRAHLIQIGLSHRLQRRRVSRRG